MPEQSVDRPSRRQAIFGLGAALAATTVGVSLEGLFAQAAGGDEGAPKEKAVRLRPKVVAFDVVETLFALDPVRERFKAVGLPPESMPAWFAGFLRDAMALEITGVYKPFKEVAASSLQATLSQHKLEPTPERVGRVLDGFGELPAHPDVRPAFQALRDEGVRIFTLTNGSADATTKLLKAAGLDGFVERAISIDEVKRWKPAREVYLHAAKSTGVAPEELALVAAHAWDVQGAASAGLTTGWVARSAGRFPPAMHPPTVTGDALTAVVKGLLAFDPSLIPKPSQLP